MIGDYRIKIVTDGYNRTYYTPQKNSGGRWVDLTDFPFKCKNGAKVAIEGDYKRSQTKTTYESYTPMAASE